MEKKKKELTSLVFISLVHLPNIFLSVMSRTKLLSDNSNSSRCLINDNIRLNLYDEYNKIINDMKHKLFFDQDLTYQHLMFILNNRKTIENKLIDILFDRINQLNVPFDIREDLISNINKFSIAFTPVSNNNQENQDEQVNNNNHHLN
jgi:hypothetical protein